MQSWDRVSEADDDFPRADSGAVPRPPISCSGSVFSNPAFERPPAATPSPAASAAAVAASWDRPPAVEVSRSGSGAPQIARGVRGTRSNPAFEPAADVGDGAGGNNAPTLERAVSGGIMRSWDSRSLADEILRSLDESQAPWNTGKPFELPRSQSTR